MIDPQKITFPISYEELTAMQAAEVGRELTPVEKELFLELETMANSAYVAACTGNVETVKMLLVSVNKIPVKDDANRHLVGLFNGWIQLAIRQGVEVLSTVIDGQN